MNNTFNTKNYVNMQTAYATQNATTQNKTLHTTTEAWLAHFVRLYVLSEGELEK